MSTDRDLPLWIQDREEVLKNDAGVEWRDGQRPDYSMTNAHMAKEKKYQYEASSLEAIAYNLVRTFEMEASFKTNPLQMDLCGCRSVSDEYQRRERIHRTRSS